MSKVVLDTDVLIDVLRGRASARAFLLRATDHAIPCCSVISVAEIHAGMRSEERDQTSALLDSLVLVDVTRAIAELAGRFKQRERSRRLELADCLIAATAVVETAVLATGNARDYPMPELTLLAARG
jgi:predicted nucleic acid-binding protein